jgi:hypothetical protein
MQGIERIGAGCISSLWSEHLGHCASSMIFLCLRLALLLRRFRNSHQNTFTLFGTLKAQCVRRVGPASTVATIDMLPW